MPRRSIGSGPDRARTVRVRHERTIMSNLRGATIFAVLLIALWTAAAGVAADAQTDEHPTAAVHPDEEQGGEHAAEGPNLFTGDLGNIFWTLLTFGLVLFVLGKWAWGPVLTALQKREDFIRDSLASAKADRESAETRLREYEQRMQASREEATAIVDEGRRDAEVVKAKIEQNARAEGDAMIERAKREIEIARDTAVKEIYNLTADLATEVAGRIIGKELDPSEHDRLVTEAIDSLSQLEPSGGSR